MPYKSRSEYPPALAAIKPPLTPEQATAIADQADAIGTGDGRNGWAIAIANFKKTYRPSKGRWVKKTGKEARTMPRTKRGSDAAADTMAEVETPEAIQENGYVPYGVTSFSQLKVLAQASELAENLNDLTEQLYLMLRNIITADGDMDRVQAIRNLVGEYITEIDAVMGGVEPPEVEEPEPATAASEITPTENAEEETGAFELKESATPTIYAVEEAELSEAQADVLYMNAVVIEPGWGNTRDNNFYPPEMLKANAERFAGAKMYETDHRNDERSTRTWVSTITGIEGFTQSGAPIARIAVHDPNFAERVRNLNAAGLLSRLECSIYAAGKAEPGFESGGRKGNRVTEITDVHAVDWVTAAGAGGRADSIAESAAGLPAEEEPVEEVEVQAGIEPVEEQAEEAVAETPAPVTDKPATEEPGPTEESTEPEPVETAAEAEGEPVESEPDQPLAQVEESDATPVAPEHLAPVEAEVKEEAAIPVRMSEGAINLALQGKFAPLIDGLPEATVTRIRATTPVDEAALEAAIRTEIAYLKEVSQSGTPFAVPPAEQSAKPVRSLAEREAEAARLAAQVDAKYFRKH